MRGVKSLSSGNVSCRRRVVGFAALVAAMCAIAPTIPASAQDASKYEVIGFRDARFGMSEQEVRAILTKNFGVKAADITSAPNQVEGTTVLTARVPSLDPGPGVAHVAFIFGFNSKKLI